MSQRYHNPDTKMGDTFCQNRARRANNNVNSINSNSTSSNRNSKRDHNNHRTPPRKHVNKNHTNTTTNSTNQKSKLEYGRITSLLDKFGFIYCANRPMDIFFHYSELVSNQNNDTTTAGNNGNNIMNNSSRHRQQELISSLQIGQEVQFYVRSSLSSSSSSEDKLSAYSVTILKPGTVIWEIEDEPDKRKRGLVERIITSGGSGRSNHNSSRGGGGERIAEGTIRILLEDDNIDYAANDDCNDDPQIINESAAKDNDTNNGAIKSKSNQKGPIVRYTIDDTTTLSLSRNDLVEFSIYTEIRSGIKYARNVILIQTERERLQEEKERMLMEKATYERGIVTSLKNGFGFLKSNRRKEEIYFHYSNVVLPDQGHDDDINDNNDDQNGNEQQGRKEEEHTLKEGQEMEFFVVTELDEGGGSSSGRKKTSARQIRFLDKGSVIFQQSIATGVVGKISNCPIVPEVGLQSARKKPQHKSKTKLVGGKDGSVKLDKSISFHPVENYDSNHTLIDVTDVTLPADVCPFIERDGSKTFLWVREGDTLLFDVIRDVDSGICRVSPTMSINSESNDIDSNVDVSVVTDAVKAISVGEGTEDVINNNNNEDGELADKNDTDAPECKEIAPGNNDTNTMITENNITPKVRIVSLSPDTRKEGTIVSIKDNFGFIRPSDQNSDIYFRLDELLPPDMTEDLWRNSLTKEQFDSMKSLKFSNGCKVMFDLSGRGRNMRAERIMTIENKKPLVKKTGDSTCQGYVLMEPTHTSLSHTPSHTIYGNSNNGKSDGGRWDNCVREKDNHSNDTINPTKEEGSILLLSDPATVFENARVSYVNNATRSNPDKEPKRGDLVCFVKGKDEKARDIRILKRNAATTIKGKVNNIDITEGTGTFNADDGSTITISLSEVISCAVEVLKNDDKVEGIVHEDKIFGSKFFLVLHILFCFDVVECNFFFFNNLMFIFLCISSS